MHSPSGRWQQLSLVPPDRVHLRLDVYIVGCDPIARCTSTLFAGALESLEAMWTIAVPLDAPTPADVGLPLALAVLEARGTTSPF